MLDKSGKEDERFSTYQVNPGAERLFERVGFEDGDKVSQETFYALLLDGDLYNDARPNGIEIVSVPKFVVNSAQQKDLLSGLFPASFDQRALLSDIYDSVLQLLKKAEDTLSASSWICIRRHYERHLSKKKNR